MRTKVVTIAMLGALGILSISRIANGHTYVINNTCSTVTIVVHYLDKHDDQWKTSGTYSLPPGRRTHLVDGPDRQKGNTIYFWARSRTSEWKGRHRIDGYHMRQHTDGGYDVDLRLIDGEGGFYAGECPQTGSQRILQRKEQREERRKQKKLCKSQCDKTYGECRLQYSGQHDKLLECHDNMKRCRWAC